jgi:DNA-binding protein HU-beta
MRSVSKQQMVNGIAGRLEMQKSDVDKVLNAFIDELKDNFRKGKRVEIHQFGTFFPQKKKARVVKIPGTGKDHQIGARTSLKFRTSKYMVIEDQP